MSNAPFHISPLETKHDRMIFNSGSESLDRYLRERATQDIHRRVAACFVALSKGHIAGYYTLASASLMLADLPTDLSKKLPRYPSIPAIRMGRLAVDQTFKGQGLGGALLADALDRALHSEIAAYALMVDAKNKSAISFYQYHGFITLPESPMTLFLPLATALASQKSRIKARSYTEKMQEQEITK